MTTSYPGAIDSLTNPTPSDPLNSANVPHAAQHANANDAIEAIQTELGTNPSGSAATVKARLDSVDTQLGTLQVDVTVLQSDVGYRVKGYTSSNQPASPQPGDLWVDPDDSSVKIWNGSAFVNPSNAGGGTGLPWAVVTGGTVTEYTHPTYGVMSVHTFTGNGTLTCTTAGLAQVFAISGGSGGTSSQFEGGGGDVRRGLVEVPVAAHAVTIGTGGPGGQNLDGSAGNATTVGTVVATTLGTPGFGSGSAKGSTTTLRQGLSDSTTGTAIVYGAAAQSSPVANRGQGGISTGSTAGSSGVVIVAVKKP